MAGTSFAAPQAAGVFALMMAQHPRLSPEDLECGLRAGALTDGWRMSAIPLSVTDGCDAAAAVDYAAGIASGRIVPEPRLDAVPATVDFGQLRNGLGIDLRVICGTDPISGPPQANAGWLTVLPAEGVGAYRLEVDRSALMPSVNRTTLTASTVGGRRLDIPVTAVGGEPAPPDAGVQYVQLRAADAGPEEAPMREQRLDAAGDYT
ncbi:MAG: S8 family serine peptidase [Arhodomonas sp.]|nr:S8 family serine peptidase [Arhodomonas sp.]